MLEIYLKTVEDIKTTALTLIEKERDTEVSGQNNTELLVSLTQFALGETDRLFEQVIQLPGDGEKLYRCRLLMIEALEDLRESFEQRYFPEGISGSSSGAHWHAKRAGYLLKMQAAEQEVASL